MKHLTSLIWYHWTIIQDKQEIAILKKYTKFSRRFTIFILRKNKYQAILFLMNDEFKIYIYWRNNYFDHRCLCFEHVDYNDRPHIASDFGHDSTIELNSTTTFLYLSRMFHRWGKIFFCTFITYYCDNINSIDNDDIRRNYVYELCFSCLRNVQNC